MVDLPNTQWWLARLDQYGNPTLCDGAHGERAGVERAMYLLRGLGLDRGHGYAVAEVRLTAVEAKAHGANEDAIAALNAIGLRPSPKDQPQ